MEMFNIRYQILQTWTQSDFSNQCLCCQAPEHEKGWGQIQMEELEKYYQSHVKAVKQDVIYLNIRTNIKQLSILSRNKKLEKIV